MTGKEKRRLAMLIRRPTGKRDLGAVFIVIGIISGITTVSGAAKGEANITIPMVFLALGLLLVLRFISDKKFLAKFSDEQLASARADAEKADEKVRKQNKAVADAAQAKVDAFDAEYGKCVAEERFGLKKIRIYANGYVRITGGISDKGMDTPEKLVAVASNTDRMVARGNKGGNVLAGAILTIVTSETSYTIKAVTNSDDLFDTPGSLAALERILAVGNSVIK